MILLPGRDPVVCPFPNQMVIPVVERDLLLHLLFFLRGQLCNIQLIPKGPVQRHMPPRLKGRVPSYNMVGAGAHMRPHAG